MLLRCHIYRKNLPKNKKMEDTMTTELFKGAKERNEIMSQQTQSMGDFHYHHLSLCRSSLFNRVSVFIGVFLSLACLSDISGFCNSENSVDGPRGVLITWTPPVGRELSTMILMKADENGFKLVSSSDGTSSSIIDPHGIPNDNYKLLSIMVTESENDVQEVESLQKINISSGWEFGVSDYGQGGRVWLVAHPSNLREQARPWDVFHPSDGNCIKALGSRDNDKGQSYRVMPRTNPGTTATTLFIFVKAFQERSITATLEVLPVLSGIASFQRTFVWPFSNWTLLIFKGNWDSHVLSDGFDIKLTPRELPSEGRISIDSIYVYAQ